MAVNPDIAAFLALAAGGREDGRVKPMHALSPVEARLAFERTSRMMDPGGEPVGRVEDLSIPARDGVDLPARLYVAGPTVVPGPVLLFFHGGGYVVGSLDSHDGLCRSIASKSGVAVLSVGYRLAPEHRFPTAFDDALDALGWLGREGAGLGIDAGRLAAGGDSVGGSLAAAISLRAATDPDLPRPRLQVLIYPVTDATADTGSLQRYGEGHLLERATLDWFYCHYARDEADRRDGRFSPLLAELPPGVASSLAPALLVLAECDPLVDEGIAYGRKLAEAGAAVDVRIHAGMTHDFLRMSALVDEAEEAQDLIADALRRHLDVIG
ncbi:acetyl esterase [Azospirillum lipoferum]|uniref:Alpha/beta hydrolase n=1 Tax=Azospirillum lipoferum TaxID=193 RepID=A0A5A9FRM9_AZOLI|nr:MULTISPECIES: alpha/beta hydrolase [Azospirillum]KAA0584833.1 alpha/beta hydrolase [Azospirillum lipoferum]MCP1615471.1 acetyl esterase [Azospirillum lipoferum]MDW5531201.1 alpha/beta hydrolase [Azospirillum sp. NL1]